MPRQDDLFTLPPSVNAGYEGGASQTSARVRATLRLMFDAHTSDALLGDAPAWLSDDGLRQVARKARARFGMELLRSRLLRRKTFDVDRPLPPGGGATAEAALALALHLGLSLDAANIADMLDRDIDDVGTDLERARRSVDLSLPVPCRGQAARVGRYRDRHMEQADRLGLFTHLGTCERCQQVIEHSKAIDADLADELRVLELEVPAPRSKRSRLVAVVRGVGVAAACLVGLLVALAAFASLQSAFGNDPDPVPLLSSQPPSGLSGWLILASTNGRLQARNLATGETRWLNIGDEHTSYYSSLSPDKQRIATWGSGAVDASASHVVVNDLQGNQLGELNWDNVGMQHYPAGWLNGSTLLVGTYPTSLITDSAEETQRRIEEEASLLAVDIASGTETVLLRGAVGYAVPAPDGRTIAIVRAESYQNPDWPGASIDIRPIDGLQLGEPVATIEHRVVGFGELVWANDGSQLYVVRITDPVLERIDHDASMEGRPPAAPFERGYAAAEFIAIGRTGTITHIGDVQPDIIPSIMSVSPDGRYVSYFSAQQQWTNEATPLDFRIIDTTTGTDELMASDQYLTGSNGVDGIWSPDSSTMLTTAAIDLYLEKGTNPLRTGGASLSVLTALRPGQPAETVNVDYTSPGYLAAWLPDDALPSEAAETYLDEPTFTDMEPVYDESSTRVVDANSSVSPAGDYTVLAEGEPAGMLLLKRDENRGRRLRANVADPDWLSDGSGVIGVTSSSQSGPSPSRLTVYATETFGGVSLPFDLRQFDPFDIGQRMHVRYAKPLISPDGRYTSYFVINTEIRTTELWIVGIDGAPERIASWIAPENALIDPPLLAEWVDADTLLFAEADDWSRGLPQTARFVRLTIGATNQIDRLLDIVGRGDDRGIALAELSLSPDGLELAYRLRHYSEVDADRGRSDTLHVATTSDISHELQVARGRIGYGLTWIDDGKWLAAGLHGQLAVVSVEGLDVQYITDESGEARYPLHVGNGEIWFAFDNGSGSRIMRVVVQ